MIDRFLRDAWEIGVLSFPFWTAVLQCGARLPMHIFNYWTVPSVVPVLTWCVLVWQCSSHLRSVAVLCMLYKIRCNPMHPLYGAITVPYLLLLATRSAQVAHRCSYIPPRCRTSQYHMTVIPLSVFLWNELADLYSMVWDILVSRAWCIFVGFSYFIPFLSSAIIPFLFFLSIYWYCGVGVFGLIGCKSLSPCLALPTSFNNNYKKDLSMQ